MASARLRIEKDLIGPILDLGGGGEGVIGQIYRQQAVVIDNRQEELDETPEGPEKLLMDAAELTFADGPFQHVTEFFSLMYMPHAVQAQAIIQAARVLRPGGSLQIWDAHIISAFPDPFFIDLDIDAAGTAIHTTYGILKEEGAQDCGHILRLCQDAGLRLAVRQDFDGWFYLRLLKKHTQP